MKSRSSCIVGSMFLGLAVAVAACGGAEKGSSSGGSEVDVSEASGLGGRVCDLLSSEQVSSVLPGHDGGSVTHSGGSLLKGVDAFQCSYTVVSGTDLRLLTVILNVASTDELFATIKPSGSANEKEDAVSIGDGGWSWGAGDDWKIRAMKGRTLVDLELMAPDAKASAAQLLNLAKTIVDKL